MRSQCSVRSVQSSESKETAAAADAGTSAGTREGNGFTRAVDRASGFMGALAGAAIIGILVLVCAEILMRNLLGRSTMISDEISGYLNAAAVFLALGYTLREGAFIRVDSVYRKLRGRALLIARWTFTVVTLAAVLVLLYVEAKYVLYLYGANVRSDGLTQTYLYIPQSVLVIGLAVLAAQLVTYVVKRMRDVP
jgi:TRAP-type mannitol/chloroaromatic compound transport system permease small subunit